jgi:hypothetical protein
MAYYHCLSRVVDRQFVFGELEREQFVRYLREYEAWLNSLRSADDVGRDAGDGTGF